MRWFWYEVIRSFLGWYLLCRFGHPCLFPWKWSKVGAWHFACACGKSDSPKFGDTSPGLSRN